MIGERLIHSEGLKILDAEAPVLEPVRGRGGAGGKGVRRLSFVAWRSFRCSPADRDAFRDRPRGHRGYPGASST